MQEIYPLMREILEKTAPDIIEKITDIERTTRKWAIDALTASLSPHNEQDKVIFQTLPLAFLERDDLIWALWYIETIGASWNTISYEIFERVCHQAFNERAFCIEAGDEVWIQNIDTSLSAMFQMVKSHPGLSQDSRFILLTWAFEEERWNPYKAISFYDEAILTGAVDGYLASASIYEKLDDLSMSRQILEVWYQFTADMRILSNLVRIACLQGDYRYAVGLYSELKIESKEPPLSFLIYKGKIESDTDLYELESIIAVYVSEGSFMPSEALFHLSESAAAYIALKITSFNARIDALNKKWYLARTDSDNLEYQAILFERLKYLQIDIFTLGQSRFLIPYMKDIDMIAFGDANFMKDTLLDFFIQYSSVEVYESIERQWWTMDPEGQEDESGQEDDKDDDADTEETDTLPKKGDMSASSVETVVSAWLYESISLHVARIGEMFFHPFYYDIQDSQIIHILSKSAKEMGEYDDDFWEQLLAPIERLKDNVQYYDSLKESIRENYETFITEMDEKYGVFFRRHIQNIAIYPDIDKKDYPDGIKTYPDIALLFWIEKILAEQFPTNYPEDIEWIIQEYRLTELNITQSLLLGTLLFDISREYAISFLANYPNMLNVPEAVYTITEWLRYMGPKERKIAIKDLHVVAQQDYDARGFFEHLRFIFRDIIKTQNPTETDMGEILLVSGNMAILQKKWVETSLLHFQTAWDDYNSLTWLLQAGNTHNNIGEYDQALDFFQKAFAQQQSIDILHKILEVSIISARFDIADQYIQYALARGYNIGNYLMAYHLWQGHTEDALLQVIDMVHRKEAPLDTPPWTIQLLWDTLSLIIHHQSMNHDEVSSIHKVYATFLISNIWMGTDLPDVILLENHWYTILDLIESYEWEHLHMLIERVLSPIITNLDSDMMENISSSERSVEYLSEHGENLITTLRGRCQQEAHTPEAIAHFRDTYNRLISLAIITLERFPDTESNIAWFRGQLEFIPHDPSQKLNKTHQSAISTLQ